jgi:hypothetical protein
MDNFKTKIKGEENLIEQIAEIIYLHNGGIYPDEYLEIYGCAQRLWKTDKPWDSQPLIELCEHERDDYRVQAQAVVKFINRKLDQISDRTEQDEYGFWEYMRNRKK